MNIFLATFPMHLDGFLDTIDVEPAIYFASRDADIKFRHSVLATMTDEPIKILSSFHYFKKVDFDKLIGNFKVKPLIFADSGAYSAASQGVPVRVEEYAEWLQQWKSHFTVYSNLDVIRDPKASAKNQAILERKGLEPIPVFHTGSDFVELDRLAKDYPYIALGGMVGQSRPACLKWAATCMKRTQKYQTKFHGFGMTSREVIEKLPWYSVDSSSWVSGAKFGNLTLFDGRKWHKAQVGNEKQIRAIASVIRSYGFDPDQFANKARYTATKGHINVTVLSALSWRRFERHLQIRNKNLAAIYLAQNGTGYYEETDRRLREASE